MDILDSLETCNFDGVITMSKLPHRRAFLTALGLTLAAQPAEAGIFGLFRRRCRPVRRTRCYCPTVECNEVAPMQASMQAMQPPAPCPAGTVCIEDLLYTVRDTNDEIVYWVYRGIQCGFINNKKTIFSVTELSPPENCDQCSDSTDDDCYLMPTDAPKAIPTPGGWVPPFNYKDHLMMEKADNGKNNNADLFANGLEDSNGTSIYGRYVASGGGGAGGQHYVLKYMIDGTTRFFQLVWTDETGTGYEIEDPAVFDFDGISAQIKFGYNARQTFSNARSVIVDFSRNDRRHFVLVLKD